MPKAYVFTRFGGPETEAFVDVDRPRPGPGQVLVAVRAAGVNPVDWKQRTRLPPPGRSGSVSCPPSSATRSPGSSRRPARTSPGSPPGDEVFGNPVAGGYAEYALLPVTVTAAKPAGLSFTDAATLPVAAATAYDGVGQLGLPAGATAAGHRRGRRSRRRGPPDRASLRSCGSSASRATARRTSSSRWARCTSRRARAWPSGCGRLRRRCGRRLRPRRRRGAGGRGDPAGRPDEADHRGRPRDRGAAGRRRVARARTAPSSKRSRTSSSRRLTPFVTGPSRSTGPGRPCARSRRATRAARS